MKNNAGQKTECNEERKFILESNRRRLIMRQKMRRGSELTASRDPDREPCTLFRFFDWLG